MPCLSLHCRRHITVQLVHMKTKTFVWIMAAAIVTGAIFGAIYTFVPALTRHVDSGMAIVIDVLAALFAGVVLIGYAQFVRWIRRRENSKS